MEMNSSNSTMTSHITSGEDEFEISHDAEMDGIYSSQVVAVPIWYYNFTTAVLFIQAIGGIILNGYVLWCFVLCPSVSIIFYDSRICYDKSHTHILPLITFEFIWFIGAHPI